MLLAGVDGRVRKCPVVRPSLEHRTHWLRDKHDLHIVLELLGRHLLVRVARQFYIRNLLTSVPTCLQDLCCISIRSECLCAIGRRCCFPAFHCADVYKGVYA